MLRVSSLRSVLLAGLGYWAGVSCNATRSSEQCGRLQQYSCHCFGACQAVDVAAIDSMDAQRCDEQLRSDFEIWKVCASGLRANGQRCDTACNQAWGPCAFDAYRAAGLDPTNVCDTAVLPEGGD
jgi:hypothetical protein